MAVHLTVQPLSGSSGFSVRFLGRTRQEQYLRRFQRFDAPTAKAFKEIYAMALNPSTRVQHVIRTAIESTRLPALFAIAKENIVSRMVRTMSRYTGDAALEKRVDEKIEDFHVAADAYFHHISLDEAETRRRHNNKLPMEESFDFSQIPQRVKDLPAEDRERFDRFLAMLKQNLFPVQAHLKHRRNSKQNPDA